MSQIAGVIEVGPAWRVVVSHDEDDPARAAKAIADLGFETYVPIELYERRHARKVEIKQRSLFGDYFFARCSLADPWPKFRHMRHVRDLLMCGQYPVSVPDACIEGLRAAEGIVNKRATLVSDLQPGDLIRIAEGVWAGHVGELLSLDHLGRMIVLMNLFGRKVKVGGDAVEMAVELADSRHAIAAK